MGYLHGVCGGSGLGCASCGGTCGGKGLGDAAANNTALRMAAAYYGGPMGAALAAGAGGSGGGGGGVPMNTNVVSVSPTINTKISPQISPNFQQQFQPNNSPLSASTSQFAPSNQTSGGADVPVGAMPGNVGAPIYPPADSLPVNYGLPNQSIGGGSSNAPKYVLAAAAVFTVIMLIRKKRINTYRSSSHALAVR